MIKKSIERLKQKNVRHYLPRHALLTLIRALVVSKVDYCNSVLAGVSAHLLDRLQSVSRRSTGLLSEEVRAHIPTTTGAPLAESS